MLGKGKLASAVSLLSFLHVSTVLADEVEHGLMSYVLENFDVQDVDDMESVNLLFTSLEHWEESGKMTLSVTPEALHGNSALALDYHNSPVTGSSFTYVLQNILEDPGVHAGADGALHAFFTYRHAMAEGFDTETENDMTWTLTLFDSADCQEDCSNQKNLEAWEFTGEGPMVADDSWQTVMAPLDSDNWVPVSDNGNNVLDLRKLKGWRLRFSSSTTNRNGTIVVDQLALDGDGTMIGTVFHAASWEEALEDDLIAPIYYRSETSENNTQEVIYDGHWFVNYTVQQKETWGGFIQYDFSAPGRAYFNMSKAQAIGFDYEILRNATAPGRAHIRFLMLDRSDCWQDCGHASPNIENYYSFHYILDEPGNSEGSVVVQLEGGPESDMPLWRTGWFGTIGNDLYDASSTKGWKIEISIDSQGEMDSIVSGMFSLADLRAHATYDPDAIDTSMCTVEPDLRFNFGGKTKFVRKEFLNFAACCKECNVDPSCVFAFANGRDCYKTDYVHHEDIGFWTDADAVMYSFVKETEDDFCDVCECRKSDLTIDCRDRDLVKLPKAFTPDGRREIPGPPSWEASVLDLRGNPRLVILQAGALEYLPALEAIHLPVNVKHVSPGVLSSLPSLKKVDFEQEGDFSNFITSPTSLFSDICCSLGDEIAIGAAESSDTTLTFCELEQDAPGADAIYEDYIQYLDASAIDVIRPSSSFMAEAALSAALCAEYCNLLSDCFYFSYDDRIVNTEPICHLLSTKGTPAEVCCAEDQMADADGTRPGWVSGYVPKTRNEKYNARVLLDTTKALTLEEGNGYISQYKLELGAMPRRGAVWITPTIVSQSDPATTVEIIPSKIVLYDNSTEAWVDIIVHVDETSTEGTIVIENIVESCDTAFSASQTNLTIYADLNLPSDESIMKYLMTSVGACLFVIICITAFFLNYVERKRRQADSVFYVSPDELTFAEPPEVLGRGSFGLVLLASYRGTQVAVKRVIPPRRVGKARGTESQKLSSRFDFGRLFGTAMDSTESGSDSADVETGTSSIGTSSKISSAKLRLRGSTGGTASGMRAAQAKHWSGAFKVSRNEDHATLRANFIKEMRHLSKLRHPCVTTVMGAVIEAGTEPMLVMEFMDHGSLFDLLQNETMALDGESLLPILQDISQGVRFLHSAKPQVLHGDLKAANVLVDGRMRAKVADFGLSQKKRLGATGTPYWMAPELLRGLTTNTAASDVYSFGIILYEVYSRKLPYDGEDFTEVMEKVSDPKVNKRPGVPPGCPTQIEALMTQCQEREPEKRPSFDDIDTRLRKMDAAKVEPSAMRSSFGKKSGTQKDALLEEVFPPHIAKALREGKKVEPEARDMVTIVFSDIVGFTTIASQLSAMAVSEMLDNLYTKFDDLSHKHDVFKVETIGDSWMGVTNLTKDQPDHVERIARFAIDAMRAAQETWIDPSNTSLGKINLRMGFHSGPVVANVVGSRNPRYCLFGDTVNSSSRMESHSLPGCIQCSEASATILRGHGCDVPITQRGKVHIKGKGTMTTYFIGDPPKDQQSGSKPSKQADLPESTPGGSLLATQGNQDAVTFNKTDSAPPTYSIRPLANSTVRFAL